MLTTTRSIRPRTITTLGMLVLSVACSSTTDGDSGTDTGLGGTSPNGGSAGSSSGGTASTGGSGASAGTPATGGTLPTGGVAGTGGTSDTGGVATGGAGFGGSIAGAGGDAGGAPTGGTAGAMIGGMGKGGTSGTAGAGGTGGTSGMGGTSGAAGSGGKGGSSGTGGSGGKGGTGACKAIGWATRNGRTGGAFEVTGGGTSTPVVVTSFAQLQSYASDGQARVIHVDGTLGAGWSGQSGDRLEIKSNKTIVGLRAGTQLRAAIHISGATNVILRNLVIRGPGSNQDQAWDNLNIESGAKNIWVDHCEFWDGQDGNADVVRGADNVTFTFNIFGYRMGGPHNLSNLIASSDDEPESAGKLDITFMFNWFTGAMQRQPRCRYGDIHVVNNLFTRDGMQSDYAISAGKDCRVLTEANHFIDVNTPIYTNHRSGSSANELRGGNIFTNTTGNTTGYGTAFTPPYQYSQVLVAASEVQALVRQKVGATLQSPTQCDW